MKVHEGIRSIQNGFTKRNSYLTNLINYYNEISSLIDKGRELDMVYLDIAYLES